jgi:hypothetical protein
LDEIGDGLIELSVFRVIAEIGNHQRQMTGFFAIAGLWQFSRMGELIGRQKALLL